MPERRLAQAVLGPTCRNISLETRNYACAASDIPVSTWRDRVVGRSPPR